MRGNSKKKGGYIDSRREKDERLAVKKEIAIREKPKVRHQFH